MNEEETKSERRNVQNMEFYYYCFGISLASDNHRYFREETKTNYKITKHFAQPNIHQISSVPSFDALV